MKYEIYKDKEDAFVLCINNVLIIGSRDFSDIVKEMYKDLEHRETTPRRVYDPVIIPEDARHSKSIGKLFNL
jgi:hypothetical protein